VQIDRATAKSLAQATSLVVAAASPLPVPGLDQGLEALLNAVFDVQDEQLEQLRRLDGKVQVLLDSDWKAGRARLKEAALPNRTADQLRDLLQGAAGKLRDAIGTQDAGSPALAQVQLDLAITQSLLGDPIAARHYAEEGYVTARRAMWVTTQRSFRTQSARRGADDLYSYVDLTSGQLKQLFSVPGESERFRATAQWFADFELAASVIGDPEARLEYPADRDSGFAGWRPGALLDHYYLTKQRRAPGGPTSFVVEEFWDKPEAIVNAPQKPRLPTAVLAKDWTST
jgi:hypothetical protein